MANTSGRGKENARPNGANAREKEDACLDDSSSEGGTYNKYAPLSAPVPMELNANIYQVLEYINLDWPSQTIEVVGEKLFAGTCPSTSRAYGEEADRMRREGRPLQKVTIREDDLVPYLVCADLSHTEAFTNMGEVAFTKRKTGMPANRLRARDGVLYAVTDKKVSAYAYSCTKRSEARGAFGYALLPAAGSVFVGTSAGDIVSFSPALVEQRTFSGIHKKEVEDLCLVGEHSVASVGNDGNLSLLDLRSGEHGCHYKNGKFVHLNSVAHNGDNALLTGDDKGVLRLHDKRKQNEALETIKFHASPITHVDFATRDVFASSSDCELCMWDMSFTEEWDHHRYLGFVHQGQSYYKDFRFIDEKTIATTSLDGICIFRPKTEDAFGREEA